MRRGAAERTRPRHGARRWQRVPRSTAGLRRAIGTGTALAAISGATFTAIFCATGPVAARAEPTRVPLAEVHGDTIYVDEVEGALALRLYQLELDIHSLLKAEAERRIDEIVLERAARERGVDVEALRAELEEGGAPVSEADIDSYLAEHPPAPGVDPARARERVAHYLQERDRLARNVAFMERLREQAGARILLDPPERPRTDFPVEGAPARGPADAPIELVHLASFGSRHGSRSAAKIDRLRAAHPDRIRQVHVHLLNDRDEAGLYAARLAVRVAEEAPERFWALHDALFAREGRLDAGRIDAIAREVGIDAKTIRAAAADPTTLGRVKQDIDRAVEAGVPREPGLFVNGLFVSGLAPYESLAELVEGELARQP